MHYKKLTVSLSPNDHTASDLLQAELGDFGFEAFVDTPDGFEGYVQDTLFDPESLNHLNPMVDCVTIKWELADVPDQNWNQEWERTGFTPIEVDGGRCVVRSTEHQAYPQAILEIIICPEMAFGSGHHQTTQMILKWIMDTQLNDAVVLDMGCGTGVLAIGMLKLGARGAVAIDIDEWSVRNTIKNAALNGVHLNAMQGDAQLLETDTMVGRFDVVVANINRNILLADMARYVAAMKPKAQSKLTLSGFYEADAEDIIKCANALGLSLCTKQTLSDGQNDWCMLSFKRG